MTTQYLGMIEVIPMKYCQGACHHILVVATEILSTVLVALSTHSMDIFVA